MATVVPMPLAEPASPGSESPSKALKPAGGSFLRTVSKKPSAGFGGQDKTVHAPVDITTLPAVVRDALAELDTDGSGTLDVAEIHSAVQLLRSSREAARRAHLYVIALLGIVGVLLAALLGVSYAAAVLAATTKSSNGALTDTNGNALRTAGSAVTTVNAGFTLAGAGGSDNTHRRLLQANNGELPSHFLSHRRRRMTVTDTHTGRRLSVTSTGNEDDEFKPKPLVLVAGMRGALAEEVCRFAKEGHFNVLLPHFDPYEDGHASVIASFKPATIVGCGELDHEYGFTADFGVVFSTGGKEAFFHIDCPGPVTADSECGVKRVFLIFQEPDPYAASSYDNSAMFEGNNSALAVGMYGNASQHHRRLGVYDTYSKVNEARWPPAEDVAVDATEDACPTLKYDKKFPTRTGVGEDDDDSWKAAVMAQVAGDSSLNPRDVAYNLCQSSVFCMIGYAIGSGESFRAQFWSQAWASAKAIGKYIAKDYAGTLNIKNQQNAWKNFKNNDNAVRKCQSSVSLATCKRLNTVVVMTGTNKWSCKAWNVEDFNAGAIEIARTCANACQMLTWYASWWQNYRVGSYDPRYAEPAWNDGAKLKYRQDYCGSSGDSPYSSDAKYYGGIDDWENRAKSANPPWTTHPKCWTLKNKKGVAVSQPIPLCRSFYLITNTEC